MENSRNGKNQIAGGARGIRPRFPEETVSAYQAICSLVSALWPAQQYAGGCRANAEKRPDFSSLAFFPATQIPVWRAAGDAHPQQAEKIAPCFCAALEVSSVVLFQLAPMAQFQICRVSAPGCGPTNAAMMA